MFFELLPTITEAMIVTFITYLFACVIFSFGLISYFASRR